MGTSSLQLCADAVRSSKRPPGRFAPQAIANEGESYMGKQFTSGLGKGDAAEWPRIEWAPIANFRPNPKNARTHSKKQIRQIAASIRQFDFLNPLIVDDKNMILAGHGRLEGARLALLWQI